MTTDTRATATTTPAVIGEVWVDSGLLMISDPCYVEPGREYDSLDAELGPNLTQPDWPGASLVASVDDGIYPVVAEYGDDGRLTELHILFGTRE